MSFQPPADTTMTERLETLAAMRRQEDTGYVTCDWLNLEQQDIMSCFTPGHGPLHCEAVDLDCRDKMVVWSIQVVDFCKFQRETVEITMNYLDRFLATPQGAAARNDRHIYQLACMASLYTAVKIHEPEAMDPKLVSSLSRGAYLPDDIEAMESKILHALKWRVNPPTSLAFVRQLLDLVPGDALDQDTRKAAYELTQFQTELAVCDYKLIAIPASTIGYAAFMNSLESLSIDRKIIQFIDSILSAALQLGNNHDHHSNNLVVVVSTVQVALYNSVVQQPVDGPLARRPRNQNGDAHSQAKHRDVSGSSSPRAIATTHAQ